ncbi:hypothetical protein [Piscibacillus halophilus]|uniref:hypothetical protein n=1 Tax=Piscibacillus halophilus TaxID=571933 RepID=UPI00240A9374|nr:hypothetical protein [Piscibacillus halophilus]
MKSIERMVSSVRQNQRLSNVLTLSEGQLITGKITKFYPGNKAAVSLLGHQLIAQLDTSLQVNKHYLMQVKGTQPSVQLKVVHPSEVTSYRDAAQRLIYSANEKANKNEQMQLANLLKQQLPIKPNQISSIIQLMRQHQVPNQNEIFSEMIKQSLPLNRETFQAVHQRINQPVSFSQSIQVLQNQLSQLNVTEELYQLNQRLSILRSQPISVQQFQESVAFQTLKEIGQGSTTTFSLFQKAGLISNQLSFEDWAIQWKSWASQNRVTFSFSNPTLNAALPFNLPAENVVAAMRQYANVHLPNENRAVSFWLAMSSLIGAEGNNPLNTQSLKNFFQLTQVERSIHQDYPSIQSLLKVVNNQLGHTSVTEPIQQLNQVLNAMHLSNHELTRDLMTFTTQLPKEALGLNQDLFMEFEGKKQNDGKLASNQCRVIFYLDMPNLNQTIIDMHVQNKHVELSVYHDQPDVLKTITKPLIPLLSERLEGQGYHSIHVNFKPIFEKEVLSNKSLDLPIESGVDYRV